MSRKLSLSPVSRWVGGAITMVSVVTIQFLKSRRKLYSVSKEKGPSCYLRLKVKDILYRHSDG